MKRANIDLKHGNETKEIKRPKVLMKRSKLNGAFRESNSGPGK